MSIARINAPATFRAPRPRLTSVAAPSRSSSKAPSQLRRVVGIVVLGSLIIGGLGLILNIGISQSVYQLAGLKNSKAALSTQSQMLSEQVDSLSSQQNLANSAAALGMIANANPVFLRIADAKVFGKPTAALDTTGRVAANNLANASMTDSSVLNMQSGAASTTVSVPSTTTAQTSYVATPVATGTQVALGSGVIPASPTH